MNKTMTAIIRRIAAILAFVPVVAFAAGGSVHLDTAPDRSGDQAALQNGAKLFVNYCLNCHSANYMRYNRLADLGLTPQQIKDNLLFTADKVGEQMRIAMSQKDGKDWFGAAPPDLTVIARSRSSADGSGADWLYTYLRSFYRDDSRVQGWNNTVFDNVGMPHVLWELQGEQRLKVDGQGNKSFELVKPGKMTSAEYDQAVGDLVGYLQYMSEPFAGQRVKIGIGVLIFLAFLFVVSYRMKKDYWKDVH